jgi:hypothetical protein
MTNISYEGITQSYWGATTPYTFTSPINIQAGQTVIIFVSSYGTTTTPSLSPADWILIGGITGTTGSLFSFYYQPTVTTPIPPSWTISNVSTIHNTAYGIILNGCTNHDYKLIDGLTSRQNASAAPTGTYGFTTTKKNTAIIQSTSIFTTLSNKYVNTGNVFTSTPSLTWSNIRSGNAVGDGMRKNGIYYIFMGSGISLNCPNQTYTNFAYTLNSPFENVAMTVSITPKGKTNQVLNFLKSF